MNAAAADLVSAFEAQDLDPAAFRHADHIAVAYEMLGKYDFLQATARYGESLNAIATKAGAADKFNTTITIAFMGLIAERMSRCTTKNSGDFIAQNPDLLSGDILETHYSPERLKSDLARRVFLLPDRS